MKTLFARLAVIVFLMAGLGVSTNLAAQDEDRKKDSLSIDDMDPIFYSTEDEATEKGGNKVLIGVIIAVVGGGSYLLISRKKK
ncbi:hypothetical protein ES705_33020 [subsurface metagenome]